MSGLEERERRVLYVNEEREYKIFSIKIIFFVLHPSKQLVLYIRTNRSHVVKYYGNSYPDGAYFLRFWL